MLPELSHEEMLRYNRQIVLRGFDFDGQETLKASHVLVVGLGGLGCAASPYLAAAGVGNLTLVDFDTVSLSNLQRQILHYDADIGRAKVESARETLAAINPHCRLQAVQGQLDDEALNALIARQQVVVDCTDNVAVREQINRLCYQLKVPLVSGAAIRMEGQLSVFDWQPDTPCYRCISRLFGTQVLSCGGRRNGAASGRRRRHAGDGNSQAADALRLTGALAFADVRCAERGVPYPEGRAGSPL